MTLRRRSNKKGLRTSILSVVALFLVVFPLSPAALADSPDPITATMVGNAVQNPNGTTTLTLSGKWDWSRGCGERVVGWEVDWNDPSQPGNIVGPNSKGIQVDVGAAAANALNPADNLVDQQGLANCSAGGSGSTGNWGPISHTYAASVTSVDVCVVVYDVKEERIGTGATGKHSTVAGGPGRNTDNSLEENFNDLHEICETRTFFFPNPKIDIEKTGPASAAVGATANYTLTVTNPGNVPLSNVTVTDNKCNAAPVRTGGDANNDNILQTTETWTYTCSRVIVVGDIPSVTNTATATGTPPTGAPVTDTDTHTLTVTQNPVINIDKTGPATGSVGSTATYTLTVTNPGNVPLSNIRVTDDKCNAAPVKGAGDTNNDNILQTTETWTYTCSRVILASDIPSILNTAKAIGTPPTGADVEDTDTHTLTVNNNPNINIDKTGPASAAIGATATYTLTVTNPGNVPLTNVTVTDDKCNAAPVRTGGDTNSDNILQTTETWTYTCSRVILAADVPSLTNTATATGTPPSGPNVTDTDTHTLVVNSNPTINIEKAGPASGNVGSTANYTLTVTNPGNVQLTNIRVTDNKCDAAPVRTGGDTNNDNILQTTETWTYTCSRVILATDIPSLVNTATATGTPPSGGDVTDTDTHTLTVNSNPTINIDKTGPASRDVGQTATYTLTVTNQGNVPLSNVIVTDNKCDAAPVRTGGDTNNDNILQTSETWTYTCSRVIVAGDAPSLINTATATGTPPSGAPVTDTDTHTVTVDEPAEAAINIVKSGPQKAQVGDTIEYTLTVSVLVNVPLTNIQVSDPRCDAAPVLDQKNGGDQDNVLEVGEVWTYTCSHKVTANDPSPLPNTATVTGETPTGEEVEDEDSHTVDIIGLPKIKIEKSGPQKAKVGDTITFELAVSIPSGDVPLSNIDVTDTRCDDQPKLDRRFGGDNDNTLEVGEVWVYTCKHKVTENDVGTLRNVAEVEGRDDNGNKTTDKDDHEVDVSEVERKVIINPPAPSGRLPFTGSNPRGFVITAIMLLIAGLAAMVLGRKDDKRQNTI